MKNRTLLDVKINLTNTDEAQAAIEDNKEIIGDLYEFKKGGCSNSTVFWTVMVLANIGMYFLLKNVSSSYIIPKMLLGNIIVFVIIWLIIILLFNISMRKKMEDIPEDSMEDEVIKITEENYRMFENPRLVLREHDFSIGPIMHEWIEIKDYTHTDKWLFLMLHTKSLIPIKIDNLKEKRRMEVLGIFSDRIRKIKNAQKSND